MFICWDRTVVLSLCLCCSILDAVLGVCVPLPVGVLGRMWNSTVTVSDH